MTVYAIMCHRYKNVFGYRCNEAYVWGVFESQKDAEHAAATLADYHARTNKGISHTFFVQEYFVQRGVDE